jgi:hypothetical protein
MKYLLLCLMIAGCSTDPHELDPAARRIHRDAAVDSPHSTADAASGTSAGVVTCYSAGAPSATCSLATNHCCFSTYDSNQNGACATISTSCFNNEIDCDGPEDCTAGESCYASSYHDDLDGAHWMVACSTTPPPEFNRILCHPGANTCPTGTTCTQTDAAGVYDLPQTIYICH